MTPLNKANIGENVTILKIDGDTLVKNHLAELGFTPESIITVMNKIGGNLVVQVKGSRIAIGENLASRIHY